MTQLPNHKASGAKENDRNIPEFMKDCVDIHKIVREFNLVEKFKEKRILVVDDEEFCLTATRNMLMVKGFDVQYQVDFCINGQEYVDKVKQTYESGHKYKIILTDFNMPVLDGVAATQQVRFFLTSKAGIPV